MRRQQTTAVSIPTLSKTTCISCFLLVYRRAPGSTAPRISPACICILFPAIRQTGGYPLDRNGSGTQGLSFRGQIHPEYQWRSPRSSKSAARREQIASAHNRYEVVRCPPVCVHRCSSSRASSLRIGCRRSTPLVSAFHPHALRTTASHGRRSFAGSPRPYPRSSRPFSPIQQYSSGPPCSDKAYKNGNMGWVRTHCHVQRRRSKASHNLLYRLLHAHCEAEGIARFRLL